MNDCQFIFLIARQRSGTNALRHQLLTHPDVYSTIEIFDPARSNHQDSYYFWVQHVLKGDQTALLPTNHRTLFESFLKYLGSLYPDKKVVVDVKYNSMHHIGAAWGTRLNDAPPFLYLLDELKIPIIHLERKNYLRYLLSLKKAQRSGKYHQKIEDTSLRDHSVKVPLANLVDNLDLLAQETEIVRHHCAKGGRVLQLEYANLFCRPNQGIEKAELNQLANFIGVDPNKFTVPHGIRKSSYLSLKDSISNYEQVAVALRRTKHGDLLQDEPIYSQSQDHRGPRVVFALTKGILSGVDTFTVNLVRVLRRRGIDAQVLLVYPRIFCSTSKKILPDDIPIKRIPWLLKMYKLGKFRAIYLKMLLRRQPTVFFPNYCSYESDIASRAGDNVVSVGTIHSDDELHWGHFRKMRRMWPQTIAVSSYIASVAKGRFPGSASSVNSVPYGVPIPRTVKAEKNWSTELRVVFAGRLDQEQKNIKMLAKVIRAALSRNLQVRFVIAGAGADQELFHAELGELCEDQRIELVGTLNARELGEQYSKAHIVVLTSFYEGLPLSLLEAMSYGCVPLTTEIASGIPEVVMNGQTGYSSPIDDVDAMVTHLAMLDCDRRHLQDLSRAARNKIASEYNIDRCADAYVEVIQKASAGLQGSAASRFGIAAPTAVE